MSSTRKLFTFEDCLRMEETGVLSPAEHVELINGELYVMRPTSPRHGAAVDGTADLLKELLKGTALIRIQGTVVLDAYAAPLPDIAVLKPRSDRYVSKNPAADDIFLIVEVALSSLDYDLNVKKQLYAITGISEYWVADLESNRVLIFSSPAGDDYQSVRELRSGDVAVPALLPDCRIPVDLLLP